MNDCRISGDDESFKDLKIAGRQYCMYESGSICLYYAKPADAEGTKCLEIAEGGDLDSLLPCGLKDGHSFGSLNWGAVD